MMKLRRLIDVAWLASRCGRLAAICLVGIAAADAFGEPAAFRINPALSSMQLVPAQFSGVFVVAGTKLADTIGIVAQDGAAQSLVAQLGGVLSGDLSGDTLTLGSQSVLFGLENPLPEFSPSSADTGSFAEVDVFGGDAASNFGAQVAEAKVAVRDVILRPIGGALTVGSPAGSTSVQVLSGFLDFQSTQDPNNKGFYPLPLVVEGAVSNTSAEPVTGNFNTAIQIPFALEYIFDAVLGGVTLPDAGRVNLVGTIVAERYIPGDFDGDLNVDDADFAHWVADFGTGPGSDADGDGDSDGADFLAWQRAFGFVTIPPGSSAVPEPATPWLALCAAAAAGRSCRRRFRRDEAI